jgi:hypothetical protein
MARGWESKAVESQIEAAENRRPYQPPPAPSEHVRIERERESLELSRTRVMQDLAAALNPKYVAVLERSLSFLDDKLKALAAKA